jgi:Uma2 family endonuclease
MNLLAKPFPPLMPGDHLSAKEFMRRYKVAPEGFNAELVQGVVYMPMTVSSEFHGKPRATAIIWLGYYLFATPGTEVSDNATTQMDDENVPQPDVFLRILPAHGGQSKTDEDGYIIGAPELVVEIAASSVSYDLHEKLDAYCANGVREYIVWRVRDETVDWFVRRKGKYVRTKLPEDGIYRSNVFPGLWLDAAALLKGNLARVLAVVQQGLATSEHARFVDKLQKKKNAKKR